MNNVLYCILYSFFIIYLFQESNLKWSYFTYIRLYTALHFHLKFESYGQQLEITISNIIYNLVCWQLSLFVFLRRSNCMFYWKSLFYYLKNENLMYICALFMILPL